MLAKSWELQVSQLAGHVDPLHLVITDNHRPGTHSLPHALAPPIKPTTHSSQLAALWSWWRQPSNLYFNKSSLSTPGVVFVQQFLTQRTTSNSLKVTGLSSAQYSPQLICSIMHKPCLPQHHLTILYHHLQKTLKRKTIKFNHKNFRSAWLMAVDYIFYSRKIYIGTLMKLQS
jgi:hypothetical protein